MVSDTIKVALLGNPNTGKTSVFNVLTGLRQKVGNYPGITVEKKVGISKLANGVKAKILDLPGTYSINTTSLDESVVYEVLSDADGPDYPEVALVISDVENLKRNLLLFTQVKDLKIPTILAINMVDVMPKKGISIDVEALEKELDTKIALISTRKGEGIDHLKKLLQDYRTLSSKANLDISVIDPTYFSKLQEADTNQNAYRTWVRISQNGVSANKANNLIDKTLLHKKTKEEVGGV